MKQIKNKIEQLVTELNEQLESDQTATVELDQSRVGRLSRMDALQGQQMGLAQKRRNEQRVRALEGALRRIESGDFGYCFVCGEEIAPERLKFDPAVTRCISCTE
ncbi:conjugal transfer protein TraR [Pseudidiomarina salinarum]|nr:conjugal transfer protein TraR [Pseudidiomarina salinarum]